MAPDQDGDTSLAVALRGEEDSAPRITAKGRGAVAEQILALAFDNGVKVREDADLVAVLESLELDSVIPVAVFATVAEILHYVYRANGRLGPTGADWTARVSP